MLQFETPGFLLALLVLIPFLLFWYRKSYANLKQRAGLLALLIRTLALTSILLALSRPVAILENKDRAILFLLDISDSVSPETLEIAWSEIQEHCSQRSNDELAGLIVFANQPVLLLPLTAGDLELSSEHRQRLFHRRSMESLESQLEELRGLAPDAPGRQEIPELERQIERLDAWTGELGTDQTHLEAACRMARGLLPQEVRRRLVIFSDGNLNRGDMLRETNALSQAGISVHARVLDRSATPEVLAEGVYLPAEVQVQAPFTAEFNIVSSVATEARVRIFRNRFKIQEQDLSLRKGDNLLKIDKLQVEEGFHQFECVVEPKVDTIIQNNSATGVVRVTGRPKVLLVDPDEREARYLEQALLDEEIDVELRPLEGVPKNLDDLLNFDVVILSDVPSSSFAPRAMDALRTYVRDMGGGLVMLGGESSFGLGGYYRTPVEEVLPVKMPIKKNLEKPNLALVLVIDKSGSMKGPKIQLAKEAAIASAEILKTTDRFGVVAFDSRAQWVTPMTSSSDKHGITQTISRLVPGGGTNFYPALHDAWQALLSETAKLKHVILLSDGQSQSQDYQSLAAHLAADGITLSTVGIGDGADARLLDDLARIGGGEYYFTNNHRSIPQILTRETMRASKSMLVEEPFLPTLIATADPLKGIDPASIPFLLGYVATQPKERAEVSMVSDYGDPILATWTTGLGKSVAFTSDAKSRWSADWIGWDSFGKFWGQLVRSVMSTGAHKELRPRAEINVHQGIATVDIDVRDRLGAFRDDVVPEISLIGTQESESSDLTVEHVGPGLFQASFPIDRYGEAYRMLVVHKQEAEIMDIKALGISESYSPEFRTLLPDEELLRSVADATGGKVNPDQDAIWHFDGRPARTPKETWWYWLILAACLLPLDIGVRRLGT